MAKVAHFSGHFEKCAHPFFLRVQKKCAHIFLGSLKSVHTFFWSFQQRAHKVLVHCHAVHSFCFRVLKFCRLLLHFASSVHSFLLPSAPKIRPWVLGSGSGSRRQFSGEGAGAVSDSVTLLSSLISRLPLCSEGDREERGGGGGERAGHARPPPHQPRRRNAAPPPPPPAAHPRWSHRGPAGGPSAPRPLGLLQRYRLGTRQQGACHRRGDQPETRLRKRSQWMKRWGGVHA
jgi:hypothetical protein